MQETRVICDEQIFNYDSSSNFVKIQVIDNIDGFSSGAVNNSGTLLYGYPEYLKINIFQWDIDSY